MEPVNEDEKSITMTAPNNSVEQAIPERGLSRRATLTMDQFLQTAGLDDSARSMMLKYDKDGDGSFSKEEVASLIKDLQTQGRANADLAMANKILKRILIGAIIFFLLLVASIFGLTFAVANLTKETTIDTTSGTLYAKDSEVIVATNSRADVFQAESFDFGDCILTSDVVNIKENILKGTNVVLQRNPYTGKNVSLEQLTASGAQLEQDVTPTGDIIVDRDGKVCFHLPDSLPGQPPYCITKVGPDHPCNQIGATRRLKERAAARRRLAGGKVVDDVSAPALTSSPLRYGYDRDLQEPAEAPTAYTGSDASAAEDESEGSHGCCK
jgi:hypothetical protein